MTHLYDIVDKHTLDEMIDQRYVRVQSHPEEPLLIFNYTEKAQYDKVWNIATTQCRGLIVHSETLEVVARPFGKFFNYGESTLSPRWLSQEPVVVTDKADGSLGILYPVPSGGYAIATRGSFTSPQALHATKVFNERYVDDWQPMVGGYTFLFEIIFPENRIVLDYGEMDDLMLLTVIDNDTGWSISKPKYWSKWPGPMVEMFSYKTMTEALAAAPRPNAEGLVVLFTELNLRIKIKQDDYVALHRVITGTSARTIWRHMAVHACKHLVKKPAQWSTMIGVNPTHGEQIAALGDDWESKTLAQVPDEFYDWFRATKNKITAHVESMLEQIMTDFAAVKKRTESRREFAEAVASYPNASAMFLLLDGRDITTYLWKNAYPGNELPFRTTSEDAE